jgi:hypothetical protein
MPIAEAPARERMPSGEVAPTNSMSATCVSACGHRVLHNPDGKRDGSRNILQSVHDCLLLLMYATLDIGMGVKQTESGELGKWRKLHYVTETDSSLRSRRAS